MKSNKQRRKEIKLKRLARAEKLSKELKKTIPPYAIGFDKNLSGVVVADQVELRHNNTYDEIPEYYLDKAFTCVDCGSEEVWTGKQQKWWYEVAKGSICTTAVRCRPCRKIKQKIKAESRRVHLEGLERKKNND
ncbi:zinc-ribbon domain containing protein [Gammaproteobacteria bacterium]|nr:zinc-ribbon domain containing protein [Gammaproteobacteria bacterium]